MWSLEGLKLTGPYPCRFPVLPLPPYPAPSAAPSTQLERSSAPDAKVIHFSAIHHILNHFPSTFSIRVKQREQAASPGPFDKQCQLAVLPVTRVQETGLTRLCCLVAGGNHDHQRKRESNENRKLCTSMHSKSAIFEDVWCMTVS